MRIEGLGVQGNLRFRSVHTIRNSYLKMRMDANQMEPQVQLENAYRNEVDAHPDMGNYFWLGVMIVADQPFPKQGGTLTGCTPFVHVHKSLWAFYRYKSVNTGNLAELEPNAKQALNDLLQSLVDTQFTGLYLQLFGEAKLVSPMLYDPLTIQTIRPDIPAKNGELISADRIRAAIADGTAMTLIHRIAVDLLMGQEIDREDIDPF